MRTLILAGDSSSRVMTAVAGSMLSPVVVRDKDEAWHELHGKPYDFLVLDHLPWRQVRPLLQRLRHSRTFALPDPWIPVLVIGATDPQAASVQLLDAGADAYLRPDCDDAELAATLRAVWRRRTHSRPVVVPHELVVHRVSRMVMKHGLAVPLTPAEFCVLQALMDARPALVSGKELRAQLDQRHDVRSMESVVFQLRTKLGRRAVETVRGRGYRLAADARWSDPEQAPSPFEAAAAAVREIDEEEREHDFQESVGVAD